MGELVYINRGVLSAGQYSAFLEYTDGSASDLPTVDVYEESSEEERQDEQDDPEETEIPEGGDTPEPAPETSVIPWSTAANTWSKINYGKDLTLARRVPKTANDLKATCWHSNWKRCIDFARKYEVPMVFVWSNGAGCGHCCISVKTMRNKEFKTNFLPKFKVVWCYVTSSDSDGAVESKAFSFARGAKVQTGSKKNGNLVTYRSADLDKKIGSYPFTSFYWRKKIDGKWKVVVDKVAEGVWEKKTTAKDSAKAAAAYIKSVFQDKMKKYGYDYTTGQYR